jgi:O-antigen ligase
LFISIDIFIESIFGRNLVGFGNEFYRNRIVSFFYDEPVAGSFIYGFSFIIIGYLFNKYSGENKSKAVIFLLPLLFLIAVLVTGERSNTIKFFIGFMVFFLLPDFFTKKAKMFSVFFSIILILIIFSQSQYLKSRYVTQLTDSFTTEQNREEFFKKNIYWSLYKSGINVFKNYPFFGVGNKNYRIETCAPKKDPKTYYLCITHPHQLYIEFLSEHGLFGTIILLSILFFLMFRILGIIIKSKNYIQAGCFLYVLTNFIPLLPSGSFFSDFNSTIFWINFSLMYACNKQTNIFYKEDLKLKST